VTYYTDDEEPYSRLVSDCRWSVHDGLCLGVIRINQSWPGLNIRLAELS